MSGPKVLVLVSGAYGARGGIAQFNRDLLDALAARGDLLVEAVGLSGEAGDPSPSGLRWSVPREGSKPGFALGALRAALTRRPRLIVSGLVGFGPLALALRAVSGARLWTTTHGIEVWRPGPRLDNAGLRRSELITTVSRYSRDRLLGWLGPPADRVRVLHNTIDLERYRPGPRPEKLVERYGVHGKHVLLTVGRLDRTERYKGHDRVLPLLAELNRRLGPVHYVVAGSGDDRPRLEALADRCGARPFVSFAGFVPDEELEAHYRLADAFVMPSTGEGFGIVFLEAMACGCPVIAGNRDGSVDALGGGDLGRLVDPCSRTELLEAVTATLTAGRRHDAPIPGVERFSKPVFRRRVDALVEQALGPAP